MTSANDDHYRAATQLDEILDVTSAILTLSTDVTSDLDAAYRLGQINQLCWRMLIKHGRAEGLRLDA